MWIKEVIFYKSSACSDWGRLILYKLPKNKIFLLCNLVTHGEVSNFENGILIIGFMRQVILTFLLTSLFWWALFTYYAYNKAEQGASVVDDFVENYAPYLTPSDDVERSSVAQVNTSAKKSSTATSSKQAAPAKPKSATTVKQKSVESAGVATEGAASASQQSGIISQEIIGKWQPVVGAEYPMEFTKYGTAIQYRNSYCSRSSYSLNGNIAKIGYSDKLKVEITAEGGVTYLEIYDSDDYSGKYKRVSQPKVINYTAISKDLYSTAIVGKWIPIDGQEYAMEFTKYGVAIQIRNSYNSRTEYKLDGDKLKIAYDNKARIALWEDSQYCYLEIFNTEDFSGRYKKSK